MNLARFPKSPKALSSALKADVSISLFNSTKLNLAMCGSVVRSPLLVVDAHVDPARVLNSIYSRLAKSETLTVAATVPYSGRKRLVGFIALQHSPADYKVLWLKLIRVHTSFRNRGIAKALVDMLCWVMRELGDSYSIVRSTPTEMGKAFIYTYITGAFERHHIKTVKQ
jgi:GNAT superfamily N-acetyltransferase